MLTPAEIDLARTVGVELLKLIGKVRATAAAKGIELDKLIQAAEQDNAHTIFDAVNALAPGMAADGSTRAIVSDQYYTPLDSLPGNDILDNGTRIFQYVQGGRTKFWLVRPNDTSFTLPPGAELFGTVNKAT